MDPSLGNYSSNRGETSAHLALKRLALLWAQENGYPIAALEVTLPKCRYRADVAAYRSQKNGELGHTVIFECKQSTPDFPSRRLSHVDSTGAARNRLSAPGNP